jgi:hypothetical protein
LLRRAAAAAAITAALAVAGCAQTASSGGGGGGAVRAGTTSSATPSPADDPVVAARTKGRRLAKAGKYAAAASAYESANLDAEANRVRRRGARALARSAQRALTGGRYAKARRLAVQSRRLRKTTAARTVLADATAKIAAAKAAERERRRLAAVARDQRTCSSTEKSTVRRDAGIPPGCATYAADLAARRAAADSDDSGGDCDPNYSGACLKPDSPDYDCSGGSGDGPDYTGPVQVVGDDPYDLDRDGDGAACESS